MRDEIYLNLHIIMMEAVKRTLQLQRRKLRQAPAQIKLHIQMMSYIQN